MNIGDIPGHVFSDFQKIEFALFLGSEEGFWGFRDRSRIIETLEADLNCSEAKKETIFNNY